MGYFELDLSPNPQFAKRAILFLLVYLLIALNNSFGDIFVFKVTVMTIAQLLLLTFVETLTLIYWILYGRN